MKKLALVTVFLFFFGIPAVVFGDNPKTDDESDKQSIIEKLERIESVFGQVINQEKFLEATAYTYGQLLNAIADAPIGSKTFFHGKNEIGVFDVTVGTQIMDGQLFHVGHLDWEKHGAMPFYNATLFWNVWSNESDNKTLTVQIFAIEDKDMLVSRFVKFSIEGGQLGNPVFVFQENLGGIHSVMGSAEDRNQDGIVDFIQMNETYMNMARKITAKKLGGSFSSGVMWNDVEVCENGVCKTMKLG